MGVFCILFSVFCILLDLVNADREFVCEVTHRQNEIHLFKIKICSLKRESFTWLVLEANISAMEWFPLTRHPQRLINLGAEFHVLVLNYGWLPNRFIAKWVLFKWEFFASIIEATINNLNVWADIFVGDMTRGRVGKAEVIVQTLVEDWTNASGSHPGIVDLFINGPRPVTTH